MLNPLLEHQLAEAGIEPSTPPSLKQWHTLLENISAIYTDYQTAEVDLRQSELLYEELYNSTWRQTQELSLMVRVREALANKLELKSIIQTVVEATAESFGYALVSVYLLRDDVLYLEHQVGYASIFKQMPITKGVTGRVARTGQAALIEDCRKDPDFIPSMEGLISEICVPIFKNGSVVGVLNVETQSPHQLSSTDLDMMTTLSEHVSLAMERAQLYTEVQQSNQKYQIVVNNIRETIFQVDTQGKFTFLNKSWYPLCGYTIEESLGKHFSQFIPPSEIKHLYDAQQTQLGIDQRSNVQHQTFLLRPDGSWVPVEVRLQRVYGADETLLGWSGTIIDSTDRLQAEQQAREMQLLVRVQEAISSKLDLQDMIRSVVETTAEIFGYDLVCVYLLEGDVLRLQSQVGYTNVIEIIPIDRGVSGRVVRTKKPILIEDPISDPEFIMAEEGITSEVCVPLMSKDQVMGFINVETKRSTKLGQSDLNLLIRMGEQVSIAVERARLYTTIQASNEKYQMVVDNVREVIFQTDLNGKIVFLNKAWERITHYRIADCMGKSFIDYAPPDQIALLMQKGQEIMLTDQPYIRFPSAIRKSDNTDVPIDAQLQRIYDGQGHLNGIGGTLTDLTERLQAKKQEQELGLLVQVRAAIFSKLDLKETIRTIVEATAEAFGYDLVSVYLLRGDTLYLQHQVGYEIMFDPVDISVGVSGRVARTGIPALVQDTRSDPDFVDAMNAPTSEVCVPLLNNGSVIGIMNVECKSKMLTESDLNLMIALSEHVAIAVERARLYTAVVESNQKYEMVVNNVQEVIFQFDLQGIFTFLNNSWVQITGYNLNESIGKHFSAFVAPEDQEEAQRIWERIYTGVQNNVRYQLTIRRKDGTQFPMEIHVQQVYNTDRVLVGIGGTGIDISERIQAEQQALDLMLKARTVEMLKGFLTGVSHDLRTPLSVMNNSLYMLRRKMDNQENRHLDALETQTAHMQRVVEDMLDMSKLDDEIAELTPMRIEINGLIRDLLVTLENNAHAKKQHILFSPTNSSVFIMADQFMLGKVITNVVKNAIQYTPEHGDIRIETRQLQETMIQIIVQDSGIGIGPETLPHIFERFYKANEARPSGQGGTGLGLSIARKIVEMHGGTIEAQSVMGIGSTFTITLPVGIK